MRRFFILALCACLAVLIGACASMTPEQQAAVATGTAGILGGIVKLLVDSGSLTPAEAHQLESYVTAFGDSVQAWAHLFSQAMQPTAEMKRQIAELQAHQWTSTDLAKLAGGSAATGATAAVGLVRALRGPAGTPDEQADRARRRAAAKSAPK